MEHTKNEIFIKGARSNNLKNVSLSIPRNKLTVVTGVSGSGKSSLTMDTLYAEGQIRYVESLSSYARQFLMRMKKPDVDYIHGICPAIAIEQKVTTSNARSTVGTLTELYDYLRLLYARIGKTISPISGQEVKKHTVTDVVNFTQSFPEGTRVQLFAPLKTREGRPFQQELESLLQRGFTRLQLPDGSITAVETLIEEKSAAIEGLRLVIDRFAIEYDSDESLKRIADSTLTAFAEGGGDCIVWVENHGETNFNNRFELDGLVFEEPSHQLFNYNNPYGACPKCEGYGKALGIDEDKVIPDKSISVLEECVAPWRGEIVGAWRKQLVAAAHHVAFPVHRAYRDLNKAERKLLWDGCEYFQGINDFFKELEAQSYKIQNRVMLARYRGKTTCPTCDGTRLRKEANYVKVAGYGIAELVEMPISDLTAFFKNVELSEYDMSVAKRIFTEVTMRLQFMLDVGLSYLTLNRLSSTLSGGETQRINLTRTLGSNLTSSMYILDEPSIGLHPRDTERLLGVLKSLRDLGNTVVIVEHEEEIIAGADYLVDVGPHAGVFGGEILFAGNYNTLDSVAPESLTAQYMSGRMKIPVPSSRRAFQHKITLKGCRQHNLKDITVNIPLGVMTVVTGVSGSGKTTLIKQILYPALQRLVGDTGGDSPGYFDGLEGDVKKIKQVEMVNQSPIGKSSRSNPVTYVKAYDAIRDLFANQQLSKVRGFKPKHFSFNVEGGRCEACSGEGEQVVSMQFLADVHLNCEECDGKRFKQEVLDVQYQGKSIYEVLDLSVDEAMEFFRHERDIYNKIKPLQDVGLGYVKLGQSSSSLSGGEAQRVKLAAFLGTPAKNGEQIFFIFDEPTTGLHFHDIGKLLDALNALVAQGHTVLVVEHNMEIIKSGDWLIDLGPEGGEGGGQLIFEGTPEGLVRVEASLTGRFLKDKL